MIASAWIATVSTAYCLAGTMADGSFTRTASIAHNGFPLGTRVTVSPPFHGRRRFVVRDRIGWGTSLDFWTPSCGDAIRYGRRIVRVRRGWSWPMPYMRASARQAIAAARLLRWP
jgi:3D (Asp-Asp-Asp) domain-containing protein